MAEDNARKRSLGEEGGEDEGVASSKRAATGTGEATGGPAFMLKILCPRDSVGNIIGQGGSVIRDLNSTTGARIKVSQNNEHFPTTNDRIILISGSKEKINAALAEVITKIIQGALEKSSSISNHPHDDTVTSSSAGGMIVKMLIPIAASGIMIGKQGSAVRGMSEASSCHIQLGDANDPYQTFERILTITSKTGNLANVVHGAQLAATHLFNGDKDAISYINIRTSYAGTPIMPSAMGGGPHGMPPGGMGVPMNMGQQGGGMYLPPPGGMGYGMGMVGMQPGMGGMAPGMFYQQPQQALPPYGHAYGGSSYAGGRNDTGGGGGRGGRGGIRQTPSGYASQAAGIVSSGGGYVGQGGGGYAGGGGSSGGYNSGSNNGQPVMEQISPPMFSSMDGNTVMMQMGVPDHLIGSILGKGGEHVKEIMRISGCNITISQKDNYLPGTNHRSIKVIGSQNQVQVALSIIMAKLHGS